MILKRKQQNVSSRIYLCLKWNLASKIIPGKVFLLYVSIYVSFCHSGTDFSLISLGSSASSGLRENPKDPHSCLEYGLIKHWYFIFIWFLRILKISSGSSLFFSFFLKIWTLGSLGPSGFHEDILRILTFLFNFHQSSKYWIRK